MKIKSEKEIIELMNKTAEKLGLKFIDLEFKNPADPTLTAVIHKDGGADLDDCENFSVAVSDALDELDPTDGTPYTFNVSSRGIDWAFKSDEDYLSHLNQKVEVKLKNSIKGKKYYDGVLLSYDGKSVTIKVDAKNTFTVDLKNISKMNEFIDFS